MFNISRPVPEARSAEWYRASFNCDARSQNLAYTRHYTKRGSAKRNLTPQGHPAGICPAPRGGIFKLAPRGKIFPPCRGVPRGAGIEQGLKIASGHGSRQTPLRNLVYLLIEATDYVWRESEQFYGVRFSTPGKIARPCEVPAPRGDT